MSLEKIINEINSMTKSPISYKPHKYILLLAVIKLFQSNSLRKRELYYNKELLESFSEYFNKYSSENDRNRPYAPFFHLRSQTFWQLRPQQGKEKDLKEVDTVGGPGRLNELVECAIISEELYQLLTNEISRTKLSDHIMNILLLNKSATTVPLAINNPFVSYINSLHCIDANSDGSLAEAQAKNPFFCNIQVEHPWTKRFVDFISTRAKNTHIILTGHAGDGKSTIALELFKKLKHFNAGQELAEGIASRVDLDDPPITIIKDLSEWSDQEQDSIFKDIISGKRCFFLISNTGCLLNLFKRHACELGKSPVEVESDMLIAMDSTVQYPIKTPSASFLINNLARADNIDLAMGLLTRLTNPEQWIGCAECGLHSQCPIIQNVRIIQKYQDRIFARMRLLLKRTYEYGSRLTMRQLSAHFAYMLSSGLDCSKVSNIIQKGTPVLLERYMFFNRFWGDSGWDVDVNATQLKSTGIIADQGFGTIYSPSLERLIWVQSESASFDLKIPELSNVFKRLLATALGEDSRNYQARKQIRRMVYFLYDSNDQSVALEKFLGAFLNSPMIFDYEKWLNDEQTFSKRRGVLKDQLFQVLQEQFSGIKLPDGIKQDKTLYITLNRRQRNIRQSSQIVIGKVDFSNSFDLKVDRSADKKVLMLVGKGNFSDIEMALALPFLDYIHARKAGGVGNVLQLAYVDRLENLKAALLKDRTLEDSSLLLLKLDANHVLRQQRLRIEHNRVGVSND